MTVKNRADVLNLLSSSVDLRFLLRHFVTPHAYHAYKNFIANFQSSSETSNEQSQETMSSLLFTTPTSPDLIAKFFSSLSTGTKGKDINIAIHKEMSQLTIYTSL
jgi:hypothetical protein